jgi:hypothetical protein
LDEIPLDSGDLILGIQQNAFDNLAWKKWKVHDQPVRMYVFCSAQQQKASTGHWYKKEGEIFTPLALQCNG